MEKRLFGVIRMNNLAQTKVGGFDFWYRREDRFIGQRVALGKYEPYETLLMMGQVTKGDVIIDVGANIGYYSVLLAEKVGKIGKVYAIEPEKLNFEILKKNIESNKFKNVELVEAGAGDRSEERELEKSEKNYGDHRISKSPSASPRPPLTRGKEQIVEIVRLDDVIKEKVNLIKIDTQGYEPYVVAGANRIIEEDRPEIFMEYTPEVYLDKKNKEIIDKLFSKYKYVRMVDDYLNIVFEAKSPIENYCKNRKGYCDLWLSNKKIGWVEKYGKIRIKKLVRQMLGLPQTG